MKIKKKILEEDLKYILNANLPWNKLRKKTIMVTGGNGFIASYMIHSLLEANARHQLGLNVISVIRKTSTSKIRQNSKLK